jgi:hypothetical protein
MADISAIFFILLITGIAFPAMLTAWWLLFPSVVARAQTRLDRTLAKSFWFGLALVIALAIPIFILIALPFGPAKFLGWILLAASLAFSSIGSAGIAAQSSPPLAQPALPSSTGSRVKRLNYLLQHLPLPTLKPSCTLCPSW